MLTTGDSAEQFGITSFGVQQEGLLCGGIDPDTGHATAIYTDITNHDVSDWIKRTLKASSRPVTIHRDTRQSLIVSH